MAFSNAAARFSTPSPQTTKPASQPAPIRGINALDSLYDMDPRDCIYTYNFIPTEYGMRSRLGYREHATGIVGEVRTLIPFSGTREDGINDRLFACTETGIYDVSAAVQTPVAVLTWPTQSGDAGYVIWETYTDLTGATVLMAADGANGLYEYTESTGLWTLVTGLVGPTVTNIVFIVSFKNRLWMIEQDSADAWYLPTGAKTGTATKFAFGTKMKNGGDLVGLWNWSRDGGEGIDDYLVAISRGGDVMTYAGYDPANPSTWDLVGVWFLGKMPFGHRIASNWGGDLLILSSFGVHTMSALASGLSSELRQSQITARITRLIRDAMPGRINENGWTLTVQPNESSIQIYQPTSDTERPIQYVMDTNLRAWGLWRDMPALIGATWQGNYYFGTKDGRVCIKQGATDNVPFDGSSPGESIEVSLLTAYQDYDMGGINKRVQFIRPRGLTAAGQAFVARARYDYDLAEIGALTSVIGTSGDVWDTGLWDDAVWSGQVNAGALLTGATGIGQNIAVAIKGNLTTSVTLTSIDVMFDTGGMF